jgi:hypothetical protein
VSDESEILVIGVPCEACEHCGVLVFKAAKECKRNVGKYGKVEKGRMGGLRRGWRANRAGADPPLREDHLNTRC